MPKTEKPKIEKTVKKITKPSFYQAIGRRKEATARVRLILGGKGEMVVNGKPIEQYFPGVMAKIAYLLPLKLTNSLERFAISAKIVGSGKAGQLGALVHGMARSLDKIDKEQYHTVLKKAGLLTRDPRAKERRKAGFAGKARARKQSPKR